MIGSIIDGKFEIISQLGVGGFGVVYGARQLQLDRKVALKILNASVLHEADGLARFEREAKAVSALNHKNIVSFLSYGVHNQAPYMVMEFVQGRSLQQLISNSGRIEDPARALRLMRQLFEALQSAHSSGVVHRDLKPTNVMITLDANGAECVKIIDFGLAKVMPGYGLSAQKLTETGMALGSCMYMPPEQALGQSIDHRSDIYSAGCILYQMIAGDPPFSADDNIAVIYQHLNVQPKPLTETARLVPPFDAIALLVRNCLAKDPKDRYQDAATVISDIDDILSGKPQSVKLLAATHSRPLAPRRRSIPLVPVVLVAAALLGGIGLLSSRSSQYQAEVSKVGITQNIEKLVRHCDPYLDKDGQTYEALLREWRNGHVEAMNENERRTVLRLLLDASYPWETKSRTPLLKMDEETQKDLCRQYIKIARKLPPRSLEKFPDRTAVFVVNRVLADDFLKDPDSSLTRSIDDKLLLYATSARYYGVEALRASSAAEKEKCLAKSRRYSETVLKLRTSTPQVLAMTDMTVLYELSKLDVPELLEPLCKHILAQKDCGPNARFQAYETLIMIARRKGNYSEALRLAAEMVQKAGTNSDLKLRAFLQKANTYLLSNQVDLAAKTMSQIQDHHGENNVVYWIAMARISLEQKEYAKAARRASHAEELAAASDTKDLFPISARAIRLCALDRLGRKEQVKQLVDELYTIKTINWGNDELFNTFDYVRARNLFDVKKVPGGI